MLQLCFELSSKWGFHLLGAEGLAQKAGDPGHHPGQVGLHLLVGEEEHLLLVPVVPVGEDMLQKR